MLLLQMQQLMLLQQPKLPLFLLVHLLVLPLLMQRRRVLSIVPMQLALQLLLVQLHQLLELLLLL